jgi:hypothetical protein
MLRAALGTTLAALLLGLGTGVNAQVSGGKIVAIGDEWALSDGGLVHDGLYVTNVLTWFGLMPGGSGKLVLILDGQSWNGGFGGTYGAFGSQFRSLLTGLGVAVTYVAYTGFPGQLDGYSAVFVDGFLANAPTLTNDLATFVRSGGDVYVAGGTGTIPGANASAEAAYWQPFFNAATGSDDFGFGTTGWFQIQSPLQSAGPVGGGIAALDWNLGQNVSVGNSPNARAAIWNATDVLVATWSATLQPEFTHIQQLLGRSIQLEAIGPTNLSYTVWANSNLATTNWVSIGSATVAGSVIQFVDTNASYFTSRFYRLSAP